MNITKEPPATVTLTSAGIWIRKCQNCQRVIEYSTKGNAVEADKHSQGCKKCYAHPRGVIIPRPPIDIKQRAKVFFDKVELEKYGFITTSQDKALPKSVSRDKRPDDGK